ncbi:hypothetical protein JJV70_20205 [Streptomyces sp. JJ66]|uniref:hypothetical protein n=1 Tax=Streptomyces sp. JJ66 TaxID=2803843 RepID=UPI001C587F03|nr:hypothetical protein [Streptomyces sp. JJ66]MBW1604382.1 hypothetical protein [Streptomyces sp. JJ66]
MTVDDQTLLYRDATHAPWREILRQRWSGRRDRALVLRDAHGDHVLLGAGRRSRDTVDPGTFRETAPPRLWGR